MKLRQKLFLILLFMTLLPTVCITAISYYRYEKTLQQQMHEYSSNLFSQAVLKTNNTLEDLEKVTSIFSSYSPGNSASLLHNLKPYAKEGEARDELSIYRTRQSLKYMCQNLFNTYDFIYGIYLFTPSGVNFNFENTTSSRLVYEYTPNEEGWYDQVLSQEEPYYISGIAAHDTMFQGSKKSFFIAKRLYDIYSSQNLGILLINCDPTVFDLSSLNTIPDVTSITIANCEKNEIIYSTTPNDEFLSIAKARSQSANSTELALPSLTLFTSVDNSQLYREFNTTGVLLILAAVLCLIAGIILALYFSRFVTRPIVHLSKKMSKQHGENLTLSTRYLTRSDEIGILYNEYNSMIEELNTAIRTTYQNKLISLDAQMKSLEARINSHFLFNTLEAINSIAMIEGSTQITTMSMALGNMFRYAIKTKSELMTLQDEINHVIDYISIQSIRFNHRFSFRLHIPERMRDLKVLKLILQPIVENSFSHGLQNCQYGHLISIFGFTFDTCFYIYVVDDGKGMTSEQLKTLNDSLMEEPEFTELGHRTSQSIGLKNINTRIELYYGKGYGLLAQSKPDKGTLIRIKLPYLEKEDTNVSLHHC